MGLMVNGSSSHLLETEVSETADPSEGKAMAVKHTCISRVISCNPIFPPNKQRLKMNILNSLRSPSFLSQSSQEKIRHWRGSKTRTTTIPRSQTGFAFKEQTVHGLVPIHRPTNGTTVVLLTHKKIVGEKKKKKEKGKRKKGELVKL